MATESNKKEDKLTKLGKDAYFSLQDRGGYIKGYGDQFRVMDKDHNPQFNMPRLDLLFLIKKGVVEQKDLVYILSSNHATIFNKMLKKQND